MTQVDTDKLCLTASLAWPEPGPAELCGAQEQPAPSRDPQHRGDVGEHLFVVHVGHMPTEVPRWRDKVDLFKFLVLSLFACI